MIMMYDSVNWNDGAFRVQRVIFVIVESFPNEHHTVVLILAVSDDDDIRISEGVRLFVNGGLLLCVDHEARFHKKKYSGMEDTSQYPTDHSAINCVPEQVEVVIEDGN